MVKNFEEVAKAKRAMDYESEIMMLPAHMHFGIISYIEDGVPPGGFLTALFENDLKNFAMRADHTNRHHLLDFVSYMVWHMPAVCHGSPEKVAAWINQGGMNGRDPSGHD